MATPGIALPWRADQSWQPHGLYDPRHDDLDDLLRGIGIDPDAKPAKPFVHRPQPSSKCPTCTNKAKRGGREYCRASGEPITPLSGTSPCAYEAVRQGVSGAD